MNPPDLNPYSPPREETEPYWTLPPDTEFLFNDEYLASTGTLELPKVCVISGERSDLIAKESTITAFSARYRGLLGLVITAVVMLFMVLASIEYDPPNAKLLIPVTIATLSVLPVYIAAIRNPNRLQLRWYISRAAAEKLARERMHWRLIYAAVGGFLLILALALNSRVDATVLIVLILVISTVKILRRPSILRSAGSYNGLVLVEGFQRPFIEQLSRMMNRYHENGQ